MSTRQRPELTNMLLSIVPGDSTRDAQEEIFREVYDELRGLAASLLRRERPGHTLQPTALVHEAYLRLVDHDRVPWHGRAHFFGAAARAMRQILVDHARRRNAAKRSPGRYRVTLDDNLAGPPDSAIEILALDDMLTRLAALDARMARIVELRIFGGLSIDESAQVLGVSARTVDGDWSMAKKWIRRELTRE
ncbi:MAG: sigma-70 family RNA polymerase sigma factor [Candidatus Eisenbacteria bacterium]